MIKELVKDEATLSQVCTPATAEDAQVADDLVETLTSMDGAACLAANQIGATTCIIAYLDDDDQPHVMYNPRLLQALGAFKAVEGCLSLEADSKVTRFDRIKVGYSELVDGELKPRKKDFNGWTAQIIHTASTLQGQAGLASWARSRTPSNALCRPRKLNRACAAAWVRTRHRPQSGISRQGSKRGITVRVMHAV